MKNYSIRKASIINIIGKYLNVFVGLVFSAILSRILTPKEFGTVAVVTVFTSFFSLLANMGIGPAIIHNKNLSNEDVNHIYSFTVWAGLAISLLFALFAFPLSWFYSDSKYIPIGIVLSTSLFFNAMNIVPNAILLKELKFKMVNIRAIVVHIAAASIAIVFAINGASYFAIVIQSVLSAYFVFLWNRITVKPKFVLKIDKSRVLQIRGFSSYQFAFSFINYFSRNLDNILIGRILGDQALGFYNKSYQMMMFPLQQLTHAISPVLHPILSNHQDDKKYIYQQYLKVVKVLSLLGIFITVIMFFAAEEVIFIMFGDQWSNSVQSFRYLSLSIWTQMITSSAGSIFQSIGNTKLLFQTGLFSTIIIVGSIIIGISFSNINAVALMVSIGYSIIFIVTYYILIRKGFKNSIILFYKNMLPDFISLLITFTGSYFACMVEINSLLWSALYKFMAVSIVYICSLLLTKQFKFILNIFKLRSPNNRRENI